MEAIITAVYIVGVLSVLIIAHELGHFLAAKWCGMHVEDFSLFFGPRLFRLGKWNGTEYNIRTVPLGGFVKIAGMEPDDLVLGAALLRPSLTHGKPVIMHGLSEDDIVNLRAENISDRVRAIAENALVEGERKRLSPQGREELKALLLSPTINEEEHKYLEILLKADAYEPDPRGYNQKPLWKRALTIFAGPLASLLFALIVFVLMGCTLGLPYKAHTENVIETVAGTTAPAYRAGLRPGDRIVQIDNTPVSNGEEMVSLIRGSNGRALTLQVERGSTPLSLVVTPELKSVTENKVSKQVWVIGVGPKVVLDFQHYAPLEAVRRGTELFVGQITGTLQAIFSKDVGKNTGGIIAIGTRIHEDSKSGFANVLFTGAYLSLTLGVVNLFPIPVLDGGHLLLLAWEGIRRRKLSSKEVVTAQLFGFSIIAVLFVVITCKDFIQFILPHLIKHG